MLTDYQRGYLDCLRELHELARTDQRGKLMKKLNYMPRFQKGRWSVASDIARIIDRLLVEDC